jgi:hypothetical protein
MASHNTDSNGDLPSVSKTVLMSTDEALAYIHGEMETFRDGDVTHQNIQTNLADVICGGMKIVMGSPRLTFL